MGQSLNLYMCEPSGRKLHDMYFLAWNKGLKTTYYLRTLAATQIEKSTVDVNRYGVQPRWMKHKSASSEIAVTRSSDDHERQDGPVESVAQPHVVPATDMSSVQACRLDDPDCESCQ